MNIHPNDPLAPEERELAQLMARLGPTGEPSPALDAKILAAAHAAATRAPVRTRKPRWPVAMGLAASVVFAVGIAWQLRPVQQVAMTVQEAPVAYSAMVEAPEATGEASAAAAPGMAADAAAEDVLAERTPTPEPAFAPPSLAEVAAPPAQSVREPPPRSLSHPLPARKMVSPTERTARRNDGYAASPPPPAPPPPQTMSAPAPSAPQAFAADSEAGAMADADAAADAAASSARGLTARQSAARNEMKTANAAAAREQENTALDRVEVTGSRLRTDLQVPVSDDARLAVDDWLERVRTRYGLGDADAARQSLLLFVKDHPSETVPEDLEPLLDE